MGTRVQSAVIVHCSPSVGDDEFGSSDAFTAELEQIEAAEGVHHHHHSESDDDQHDDADDSGDLCDEEEETTSTASARAVPKLSFAALTAPGDASAMRRCSMPGTSMAPLATALATGPVATKLKLTGAAGRVAKKTAGASKAGATSAAKKGAAALAQGARPTRQQCQSVYAPNTRTALHTSSSTQNLKQGSAGGKSGDQPLTARQVAKERAGIALGDLASARGKENAGSSAHGKREVVVSVSRYMNSNRNTKNTCTIEKTVQPAVAPAAVAASTSGALTARRSSLHDGSMSARTRSNTSGGSTARGSNSNTAKRRSDAMDHVAHSGSNPALASASASTGSDEQSPCKKAKLDNTFMPACSPVMESPDASAYAGSPMDNDAVRRLSFGAGSPVASIGPITTAAPAAPAESDSVAHKTLLKVAAELAEKDAALTAALARVADLRAQLSSVEESASAARSDTQSAMDIATEAQAANQLSRQRATAAQEELDAMRKKFDTLKAGVDKLSQERYRWRNQAEKLAEAHEALKKHCLANGLALPVTLTTGKDEWQSGDKVDFNALAGSSADIDLRRATFAASSYKTRR